MKTKRFATLCIAAIVMLAIIAPITLVGAQEEGKHVFHDLAKQSQNPVSSLISVPFEGSFKLNAGPQDKTDFVLNIKPVMPMNLTENWNLINRAIVPLISQGGRVPGQGRVFGMGDFTYQGFITPAKPGKLIWGVGPQLGMPTGMDRATSNQWTLGPSFVGLTMPGPWVIGALVSNVWNIGNGYDDAPNVHAFSAQYFVNYNMKGGWYLTSAPTITANWNADSGDVWTVPFGGGAGRVFKIGKQPVNMALRSYYNVEKPDDASDWTMQFQLTFMFPK